MQRGPNKVPTNALLVISGITLVFIAIGEMNRLATLATMPFLITYAMIEYSYFVLCMQFDINQQRLQKFRYDLVDERRALGCVNAVGKARQKW